MKNAIPLISFVLLCSVPVFGMQKVVSRCFWLQRAGAPAYVRGIATHAKKVAAKQSEGAAPDVSKWEGVLFSTPAIKRWEQRIEAEKRQFAQERARRRKQEQKSKK